MKTPLLAALATAAFLGIAACDSVAPPPDVPPTVPPQVDPPEAEPVEVRFAAPVDLNAPMFLPRAIDIGDINGDGHLDMVAVAPDSPTGVSYATIYSMLGDGSGGFTVIPTTFDAPNAPRGWVTVALGDFDGDGHLDAVAGDGGSNGDVSVLKGDGTGRFADAERYRPVFRTDGRRASAGHLASADLDGDGKLEVVVGQFFGAAAVLSFQEAGAIEADLQIALPSEWGEYTARAVAVADFDGDGRADVAHGSRSGIVITSFARGDFGTVIKRQWTVAAEGAEGGNVWAVAAMDFDGDGDADLAALGSSGPGGVLLVNDGTGRFTPAPFELPTFSNVPNLTAADLDGDGDGDLVVVAGGRLSVLVNRAPRGRTPQLTQLDGLQGFADQQGEFWATVARAADLNEDGRPELVGTRHNNRGVFVALNETGVSRERLAR